MEFSNLIVELINQAFWILLAVFVVGGLIGWNVKGFVDKRKEQSW